MNDEFKVYLKKHIILYYYYYVIKCLISHIFCLLNMKKCDVIRAVLLYRFMFTVPAYLAVWRIELLTFQK